MLKFLLTLMIALSIYVSVIYIQAGNWAALFWFVLYTLGCLLNGLRQLVAMQLYEQLKRSQIHKSTSAQPPHTDTSVSE